MSLLKVAGYLLIIVPTLIAGILLGFYLLQESLIFLGEKLPQNHKYIFAMPFEERTVLMKDGAELNCLLFRTKNPRGLVFYHHGNAGNLQSWGKLYTTFLSKGFDVFFYDYRGYGKSTGKIKRESQLHHDALELWNYIDEHFNYDRIVYFGTSLGSGVASKLAVNRPPDALVLETPYYSFVDLVKYLHPYLPANHLSKYKLRNYKFVAQLDCPVLLIHGTRDEIIPFNSSQQLLDKCKFGTLVTIQNGIHNNLPDYPLYHTALKKFLDQL